MLGDMGLARYRSFRCSYITPSSTCFKALYGVLGFLAGGTFWAAALRATLRAETELGVHPPQDFSL